MPRSNRHALALEIPLKYYVIEQICKPRGWDSSETRLEIPLEGKRSLVRRIVGPDGGRLIIRIFTDADEVREARRILKVQRLLEEHAIPTPKPGRIVENFAGRGALLVEEEHIDGKSIRNVERTPQAVCALAETFGRLHSVRAAHHGDPAAPKRSGHTAEIMGRFRHRLRKVKRNLPALAPSEVYPGLMDWARRWAPALDAVSLNSLIYTKPNPPNLYITPAPKAYLLDICSVMWGAPAVDLVQLRAQTFRDEPENWSIFQAHHREVVGAEIADETEALLPLYEGLYHLGEAAILAKRVGRGGIGRKATDPKHTESRVANHLDLALAAARSAPAPA